jgi:hypothetical protein
LGELQQTEEVVNIMCYGTQFVLRFINYALDFAMRDPLHPRANEMTEDLAFWEAACEKWGAAVISGAALDEEPESRAAILSVGALLRAVAFSLDVTRVVQTGKAVFGNA